MQRNVFSYVEAYDPGMFPQDAEEAYGIPQGSVINLASNESPYPPPGPVLDAIRSALDQINRYPDPKYRRLRSALSDHTGYSTDNIALGNGSTEILDAVCKVFLEPFDRIVMVCPSYTMYALLGMLRDASVEFVATRPPGYRVDARFLLDRAEDAKVIFLCSPNNPTGTSLDPRCVRRILKGASGTVVIDEAYAEFSGSSVMGMVDRNPNLIVTRSMSKSFCLAGLRIGYAVAEEKVVESLEKAKLPFSISSLSEVAAVASLGEAGHYVAMRNRIIEERKRLYEALSGLGGVEPCLSDANFLMVRVDADVPAIADRLAAMGILVRDLGGLAGLDGQHIRVTVGTSQDSDRFLGALRLVLGEVQ